MTDENNYTTVRISKDTKEELDKQRQSPMGEVSVEDFINYLLKNNKKKWEKNMNNDFSCRCGHTETSEEEYVKCKVCSSFMNKIIFYDEPTRIIPQELRYAILKEQKWKCNNCACRLKYNIDSQWEGEVAHIDHIHPFAEREDYPNGLWNINERTNLQALYPKCNLTKYKRKQWMKNKL